VIECECEHAPGFGHADVRDSDGQETFDRGGHGGLHRGAMPLDGLEEFRTDLVHIAPEFRIGLHA